ncbi:organic cation transporter protein isoform X2 [Lingula anatina]|nr:organic cation transporter protein isoform X2 [Lingula anatina]XP_013411774.1 organic cation transporter protein isoform X2 [Lingula anatina]XP_013411776.1 organic cation transporter protein isoform X2 [Lingula anatina]|eukprot:XP_013411773.1 organic cation transporter protein isoform X2 [Lingula anatina]
MKLDDVLTHIGGYGRFQILIFVLIGLINLRSSGYLLGIVFIGYKPDHHCTLPTNATLNESVPLELDNEGNWQLSQCKMYAVSGSNKTITCTDGWDYATEKGEKTIVTEWDLVCGQDWLVDMSTTIHMAGIMCGSLFITPLSDRVGRKHVLLACLWIQTALAFGLAFTTSYLQFVILRFFIGALNRGIAVISYVMMTEVFPPSHRTLPGIVQQVFWAAGLMGLAFIAWLVKDWRHLSLVISLPTVLMVSYYWLLPESIRWLIAKGKIKEAEAILQKAARINKASLPDNCLSSEEMDMMMNQNIKRADNPSTQEMLQEEETVEEAQHVTRLTYDKAENIAGEMNIENSSVTPSNECSAENNDQNDEHCKTKHGFFELLDMFKICCIPKMAFYTITVCYLWMVNSLAYYGLTLGSGTLHGDRYINFFLSGAVELPAYFIGSFLLQRFGRRKPICMFQMLCGLSNIMLVFIPKETDSGVNLLPLIITISLLGKFGITASFSSIYLYSAEIFPTVFRNSAFGFAAFWDTVGGMAAPFVIYSSKAMLELPRTVFGGLTIVSGLLTLILPETHNRPVPETVEDLEKWNTQLISKKKPRV